MARHRRRQEALHPGAIAGALSDHFVELGRLAIGVGAQTGMGADDCGAILAGHERQQHIGRAVAQGSAGQNMVGVLCGLVGPRREIEEALDGFGHVSAGETGQIRHVLWPKQGGGKESLLQGGAADKRNERLHDLEGRAGYGPIKDGVAIMSGRQRGNDLERSRRMRGLQGQAQRIGQARGRGSGQEAIDAAGIPAGSGEPERRKISQPRFPVKREQIKSGVPLDLDRLQECRIDLAGRRMGQALAHQLEGLPFGGADDFGLDAHDSSLPWGADGARVRYTGDMDNPAPTPQGDWQTLIRAATANRDVDLALRLLERGPVSETRRRHALGLPLLAAVQSNFWEGARILLAAGADVNYQGKGGTSALHECASAPPEHWGSALQLARALLARGAQTKQGHDGADFTLGDAVFASNPAFVALLAEYKVVEKSGTRHDLLLNMATNCKAPLEMVVTLAECGVRLDAPDSDDIPLLHNAAQQGLAALCDFLCRNGLDANATDQHGATPLHVVGVATLRTGLAAGAAPASIADTVRTLLAHGANLEARDSIKQTPLCTATEVRRSVATAEALLDAGADINAGGALDMTPLHLAAIIGSLRHVKLFLERGADATLREQNGLTAEEAAQVRGLLEVGQAIRTFVEAPRLEREIAQPASEAKRLRV